MSVEAGTEKIEICCPSMGEALTKYEGCIPSLRNNFPPTLVACDGDRDEMPLKFCPWCGKEIKKKT